MSKDSSNDQTITEKTNHEFVTEKGEDISDVIEFISSCNSLSELIDKLSIENIRLWHILDDTVTLKKELEKPNISENERIVILEKIAKKSFENIETVKRRSVFKKTIDEVFTINVKNIISGKNTNVCNENKSYGR
jgi:hypothetical protein